MNSRVPRAAFFGLGLTGAAMVTIAVLAKVLGLSHGPPGATRIYLGVGGAVLIAIAFAGNRLPSAYKTLAILLLNTLVLIGIVEIGALVANRCFGPVYPHALPRASARHMYLGWVSAPGNEAGVTIDESGHRVTPGSPDPSIDPIDVFAFGGSTMWGEGAVDEETIPSHLQTELNTIGPVRVTNFGQRSWISTQNLVQLVLELRRGNVPDVVVFYDGYNDVFAAYATNDSGIPENEPGVVSRNDSPLLRLARSTQTSELLMRFVPTPKRPALREGLDKELADVYSQVVRQVNALSKEYEFEVYCFVQPQLLTDTRTPTATEKVMRSEHPWLRQEVCDLTFATYERLKKFAATNERTFDITNAFDGVQDELYLDPCHVNGLGNSFVAKAMIASGLGDTIRKLSAKRHSTD